MPSVWLCVSATAEEAQRLEGAGPRRDFSHLAQRLGATVVYRDAAQPRGWRGRLFGPHLRQAWSAAARIRTGDRVFADGEHVGIPLLLALALRGRRPTVVMIGHMPGRTWKLPMLWLSTRLGVAGSLLVHSRRQERLVTGWLGRQWRITFVPYQVDTDFWTAPDAPSGDQPLILAVGSEQRDYGTLVEAARGLPASVFIAAGSHWAREIAETDVAPPPNVRIVTNTLSFRELRERYRDATIVVVPLLDAANQAGVTTILEAMSMQRPVVVTASRGQGDVTVGPLVTSQTAIPDEAATAERGPTTAGPRGAGAWTGLYVPPGDSGALHRALRLLLDDAVLRDRVARAGRTSALAHFTFESYIEALAGSVMDAGVTLLRTKPDAAS